MTGTVTYSIAEMAELTDLTPDTLRYYERDGLMLRPVARSATGHRRYTDRDLTWIRLVNCLRGTGMGIRDIREYAELVRAGEGTEQARLELLRAHRVQVLAQLAEVQEHLGAIDRKIGIYSEKVAALDLERAPSA